MKILTNPIILFAVFSFVNVILNTLKTIIMYKKNKMSSALINMVTFGFYTIIVVMMAGEMALWLKVVLTAVTNFFGVYVSMIVLERFEKDKLWKVETTVFNKYSADVIDLLTKSGIPFNYIEGVGKYTIFNIFCATQKQSLAVKEILKAYNAKYFVSESKIL